MSLYAPVKRLLDILFGLLLAILSLPLLAIFCALVYVDNPGPILFWQKRIGRNGRPFMMSKFRTMRVDTPNVSTEKLRATGVDYQTRFGKILRKTSLDELPQLWHIIIGQMSFVGPRPALYNQDTLNEMREQAGVHQVRPGITGWAQVNGRDDLDDKTKVCYDREYIERMCLALDLHIVWRTFAAVFSSRGNY